eukprot:scaffold20849_cov57-Cylindrotheca_fusiformis.AAC.2
MTTLIPRSISSASVLCKRLRPALSYPARECQQILSRKYISKEVVPEEDYYNGHLLVDHLEYLEDMLEKTITIDNSMKQLKEIYKKKQHTLKINGSNTTELDELFHHAAHQKSVISSHVEDLKQLLMNAQTHYAVDGPDGTADGQIEEDMVEIDRLIDSSAASSATTTEHKESSTTA